MRARDLIDTRLTDEAEGIELVNRRIAQIQQLRARLRQLAKAHMVHSTVNVADEMSLTMFRLYEAKFMLQLLVTTLKRLQQGRKRATGSAFPYDARTAVG